MSANETIFDDLLEDYKTAVYCRDKKVQLRIEEIFNKLGFTKFALYILADINPALGEPDFFEQWDDAVKIQIEQRKPY